MKENKKSETNLYYPCFIDKIITSRKDRSYYLNVMPKIISCRNACFHGKLCNEKRTIELYLKMNK